MARPQPRPRSQATLAQILPSTIAAFTPRPSAVTLAIGPQDDSWLKRTLKRLGTVKDPPSNFQQRKECLDKVLSSNDATWTMASIMMPLLKPYSLQLSCDAAEGEIIHVEGYVNHTNMVGQESVVFKLTDASIKSLVTYHMAMIVKTTAGSGSEQKEQLHKDFEHSINKFMFQAPMSVMEQMEDDGSGELPCAEAEVVKRRIMGIMESYKPPLCVWQGSMAMVPQHVTSMSQLDGTMSVWDQNVCPNSGEVLEHSLEIALALSFAPLGACSTAWGAVTP